MAAAVNTPSERPPALLTTIRSGGDRVSRRARYLLHGECRRHGLAVRPTSPPQILGHVKILEGAEAHDWIRRLHDPGYGAAIERVFLIHVDAFDWNCPQHITPRFTEEQIRGALSQTEERMHALEQENEKLQTEIARLEAKR